MAIGADAGGRETRTDGRFVRETGLGGRLRTSDRELLYLAYQARLPGKTRSLWSYGKTNHSTGLSSSIGIGMQYANFETFGEPDYAIPTTYGLPFTFGSPTAGLPRFTSDIRQSIDAHVPAAVALFTALQPARTTGLPSWQTGTHGFHSLCGLDYSIACNAQHAIAIVGYSPGSLYYVDTCWPGSSGCRTGAANSVAQTKSGMPYVWRVSTSLVYDLMKQQTKPKSAGGGHEGGYYYFKGNWPWTSVLHAPF